MVAFVLAALVHHTPAPSIRTGLPAPSFAQLAAYRGKPVILNFWATWCKPCTDELKYFTQARAAYGSRIAVLTISSEPAGVAASYLRLWNIDLPLLEDPGGAISALYAVPPVPVTVVIDPDGTVGYVSVGELAPGELDPAIERALAGAAGSPAPGVLR